jgi:hypothetical protein
LRLLFRCDCVARVAFAVVAAAVVIATAVATAGIKIIAMVSI